jgi:Domain of unknown function (DUF4375)
VESYWEVVEPLFSVISLSEGPEAYGKSTASIPRPSLLLFAAHMCVAEIHNGGMLQLFWNHTGVIVPEGIEGFVTMGMPLLAKILRDALRPLGTSYPRDREDRWEALLAASERSKPELMRMFEKLDPDDNRGFYTVFVEATKNLHFDKLDKQFWQTAKTENGGFQEAATRFANAPHLLQ